MQSSRCIHSLHRKRTDMKELEKYADAEVLDGYVLVDNEDHTEKKLSFYPEDVDKILGITISEDDMKRELDRLDFEYKVKNHKFEVIVPKRRLDIDPNVNDIAEEIGRLYGYHNLVGKLPVLPMKKGEYKGSIGYNLSLFYMRLFLSHILDNHLVKQS